MEWNWSTQNDARDILPIDSSFAVSFGNDYQSLLESSGLESLDDLDFTNLDKEGTSEEFARNSEGQHGNLVGDSNQVISAPAVSRDGPENPSHQARLGITLSKTTTHESVNNGCSVRIFKLPSFPKLRVGDKLEMQISRLQKGTAIALECLTANNEQISCSIPKAQQGYSVLYFALSDDPETRPDKTAEAAGYVKFFGYKKKKKNSGSWKPNDRFVIKLDDSIFVTPNTKISGEHHFKFYICESTSKRTLWIQTENFSQTTTKATAKKRSRPEEDLVQMSEKIDDLAKEVEETKRKVSKLERTVRRSLDGTFKFSDGEEQASLEHSEGLEPETSNGDLAYIFDKMEGEKIRHGDVVGLCGSFVTLKNIEHAAEAAISVFPDRPWGVFWGGVKANRPVEVGLLGRMFVRVLAEEIFAEYPKMKVGLEAGNTAADWNKHFTEKYLFPSARSDGTASFEAHRSFGPLGRFEGFVESPSKFYTASEEGHLWVRLFCRAPSVRLRRSDNLFLRKFRDELKNRFADQFKAVSWLDSSTVSMDSIISPSLQVLQYLKKRDRNQKDLRGSEVTAEQALNEDSRIILVGVAGTGKSLLCRRLANRWARGLTLQTFDYLFLIPLNSLRTSERLSRDKFLQFMSVHLHVSSSEDGELGIKSLWTEITSPSSRCLFLVDGLDEADSERAAEFLAFLSGSGPSNSIFCTSKTFPSELKSSFDVALVTKGFKDDQISDCVRLFYEGSDSLQRLAAVTRYGDVEFRRQPLFLELLCFLSMTSEMETVSTTSITMQIIVQVLLRCERKLTSETQGRLAAASLQLFMLGSRPPTSLAQKLAILLEEVACLGFESVLEDPKNEKLFDIAVANLGILTASDNFFTGGSFIHAIFPRYLAAQRFLKNSTTFRLPPDSLPFYVGLTSILHRNGKSATHVLALRTLLQETEVDIAFRSLQECDFGLLDALFNPAEWRAFLRGLTDRMEHSGWHRTLLTNYGDDSPNFIRYLVARNILEWPKGQLDVATSLATSRNFGVLASLVAAWIIEGPAFLFLEELMRGINYRPENSSAISTDIWRIIIRQNDGLLKIKALSKGTDKAVVVEELKTILSNEVAKLNVLPSAPQIFEDIEEDSLSELIKALGHGNSEFLKQFVDSPNWYVRFWALLELLEMSNDEREVIRTLNQLFAQLDVTGWKLRHLVGDFQDSLAACSLIFNEISYYFGKLPEQLRERSLRIIPTVLKQPEFSSQSKGLLLCLIGENIFRMEDWTFLMDLELFLAADPFLRAAARDLFRELLSYKAFQNLSLWFWNHLADVIRLERGEDSESIEFFLVQCLEIFENSSEEIQPQYVQILRLVFEILSSGLVLDVTVQSRFADLTRSNDPLSE
eukprot:TRINITY_DN8524_c0_g1_i4.p1 TRINITY_DN8524_c0_g1~~TRINITY_DN8524_c0_g1_i4.p1  ORF type:complete len:1365 (-),score=286.72 TRINITY_DN8524_c0_g1_i4:30-4124(-)